MEKQKESKEQKSKKGVVLVTGASAGLGLELSKLLACDGHNLVVVARDKKRLAKLSGGCLKSPPGSCCCLSEGACRNCCIVSYIYPFNSSRFHPS